MPSTLYVCYFGVREPLVQTQVLPYLREIKKDGIEVSLLTFEPSPDGTWESEVQTKLKAEGIDWHCLRYHKRFSILATAYDIFRGVLFVRGFVSEKRPDVLHGRVHVPTLIAALGRKLSSHKPKLLFDIRGFFPEEYTDAGVWPENGWLYRLAKRVERWLLKESDGFVVLTEKAREILFPGSLETGFDKLGRPVEVIPCCVDIEKFKSANEESRRKVRSELGIGNRKVIAYVGSFGGWYMTDEMIEFFAAAREYDSETFALILTQRDRERVRELLLSRGFSSTDFFVDSVRPDEIPRYLSAADVAISFIRACYSKLSSSPTKIAEYLACGLPLVVNSGVGDIDELIETDRVGVMIDTGRSGSTVKALKDLAAANVSKEHCRNVSALRFDLRAVGGGRYRRLYSRLLGETK